MSIDVYASVAVAAAPNLFLVVMTEGQGAMLPTISMEPGENSHDLAIHLIQTSLGFNPEPWSPLRQVGFVEDVPHTKIVLYGIELPEQVPIKMSQCRWMTIEELAQNPDSPTLGLLLRSVNYVRTQRNVNIPRTEQEGETDPRESAPCPSPTVADGEPQDHL